MRKAPCGFAAETMNSEPGPLEAQQRFEIDEIGANDR